MGEDGPEAGGPESGGPESGGPAPTREHRAERARELLVLRYRVATVVKLVFGLLALILALGALLVAFGKNVSADNPLVRGIWDIADAIDGPFGRDDGVFRFTGKNGPKLDALVNWGLAAVIYLVIGNVLRRLLTRTKPRQHGPDGK